jgi:1,4-alpha-glucan branching enzyme
LCLLTRLEQKKVIKAVQRSSIVVMHRSHIPSPAPKHRYSAKNMAKPVNFVCRAPDAKAVYITGDFNDWHPTSHPMHRQPDGAWQIHLPLNHGHHHYRFLVDGKPMLDPKAHGVARDHEGHKASLVAVS